MPTQGSAVGDLCLYPFEILSLPETGRAGKAGSTQVTNCEASTLGL